MHFPRVACLLPKRNNKDYYPAAFNSISTQETPYSNILICENHSTDGSLDMASRLASENKKATVFVPVIPADTGGRAISYLLERRPTADYYHVASSDDVWSKSFLTEMIKTLRYLGSRVSAVFCDRIYINQFNKVIGASGNVSLPRLIQQEQALPYFLRGNAYNIAGALFRSDVIANAESFAVATGDALDWALMIEAARLGDIAYLCKPLYKYRLHPSNTHQKSSYSPYKCIKAWLQDGDLSDQFTMIHGENRHTVNASLNHSLLHSVLPKVKYYAHNSKIFSIVRNLKGLDS